MIRINDEISVVLVTDTESASFSGMPCKGGAEARRGSVMLIHQKVINPKLFHVKQFWKICA